MGYDVCVMRLEKLQEERVLACLPEISEAFSHFGLVGVLDEIGPRRLDAALEAKCLVLVASPAVEVTRTPMATAYTDATLAMDAQCLRAALHRGLMGQGGPKTFLWLPHEHRAVGIDDVVPLPTDEGAPSWEAEDVDGSYVPIARRTPWWRVIALGPPTLALQPPVPEAEWVPSEDDCRDEQDDYQD